MIYLLVWLVFPLYLFAKFLVETKFKCLERSKQEEHYFDKVRDSACLVVAREMGAVAKGLGSEGICSEAICVTLLGWVKGNRLVLDGS